MVVLDRLSWRNVVMRQAAGSSVVGLRSRSRGIDYACGTDRRSIVGLQSAINSSGDMHGLARKADRVDRMSRSTCDCHKRRNTYASHSRNSHDCSHRRRNAG